MWSAKCRFELTRHGTIGGELLEEAMDWLIRLREAPDAYLDRQAFENWINTSSAHRKAWEQACRTWQLLGETSPEDVRSGALPSRSAGEAQSAYRKTAGRIGLAVAACLLLTLASPYITRHLKADLLTQAAERLTVSLEDGTRVELAPATAVDTDFSRTSRSVTLLRGEAFFTVEPDASRPFIVNASGVEIKVVGTAFNVHVEREATSVDLVHGRVELTAKQSDRSFELTPGDSFLVRQSDGETTQTRQSPDDMAGWRNNRLFVENATIASVVEELRRYHKAWITIPSSDLASRRVTGLYDLSQPDRALEALVTPHGGTVHHVSPYLRVLSFL